MGKVRCRSHVISNNKSRSRNWIANKRSQLKLASDANNERFVSSSESETEIQQDNSVQVSK